MGQNPSKSISGTTVGQDSNSNATLDACARVIEESIEANYKNWPQFPQFCTCACDFGHLVQKKHDCANFPCENIRSCFWATKNVAKCPENVAERRGTSRVLAVKTSRNVAERRGALFCEEFAIMCLFNAFFLLNLHFSGEITFLGGCWSCNTAKTVPQGNFPTI